MTHPSYHRNVATSRKQIILWHPRDDDVICGRGPTKHPGNRMYHELVNDCRSEYRILPLAHKKLMAQSIVDALHPSRFLIKKATSVKPNEDNDEERQLQYQSNDVHDKNDERNSDDASASDMDKFKTHGIGMTMSSDMAISQSASFDTYSSSITSTTTSTSRSSSSGSSTPQQEGVYYYYVVLDHKDAIRKTSQALRENKEHSGNAAANDVASGCEVRLNNEEAKGTQDDAVDDKDDHSQRFANEEFNEGDDENDRKLPANKKPRMGYGTVATFGTHPHARPDGIVTFAPVAKEIVEQQAEVIFAAIQAALNKPRSSQSEEIDHDN
ncbi:hypothetical protein MHU86_23984 [Fragilaria crotonensis]|nr:hypothetical protein MHU86_23984 [Fragilaria crotonensis]